MLSWPNRWWSTSPATVSGAAGLALLAAATLDGIPENLVLGVALGQGSGGIALLAAIFAANFPEALLSSASMREQGRSQAFILGTWTLCAVLLIFAVVIGAGPLSRATHETLSLPLAFAQALFSRHSPTRSCRRLTSIVGRPSR
jgi:zinc transporter, ZIP family